MPVVSWFWLKGRCRYCGTYISFLYPVIELFTASLLLLLFYTVTSSYLLAYFIFFSALIITIRSDVETLLICRYATLGIIPLGILFSVVNLVPISFIESLLGIFMGYSLLWFVRAAFYYLTGKEGMGQGDLELLAAIGSFLGPIGVWITLLLGSCLGSIVGLIAIFTGFLKPDTRIPFGLFLAVGALIYVLTFKYIVFFLG
jgi:leader peptidase (prepilin peptidase)/N-methyltransferase